MTGVQRTFHFGVLGTYTIGADSPIDPQMLFGQFAIPAHTILADFEKARTDISNVPQLGQLWAPRLANLPPGFLNLCEQTIRLAKEKVELWLGKYMFGGQDQEKAHSIAEWLGNFEEHRTHGRPIGFDLAHEKGLRVTRLEQNQDLQEAVLSVFHATMVTFQSTSCLKIIENHHGKGHYLVANVVVQPAGQANAQQTQQGAQADGLAGGDPAA